MRLLLKLAFLIGLVLFVLAPARDGEDGVPAGLSVGALVFAVQQAATDLGGFCERAPMACESGRDAIRFVGARIGEGLTFAYGLATGAAAPADAAAPHAQPAAHPQRVPAAPPPRPYLAPAG
ncbi:DUF5330 domain-containing protein [Aureimonas flava]|uniref:DUF5330 domain-containing protein n=1 Tax=Aureimonas flava TaxID=2320271 RepID=UPI00145A00A0|nr:DUF5330 domain-containing protein [Aureimonas flava]